VKNTLVSWVSTAINGVVVLATWYVVGGWGCGHTEVVDISLSVKVKGVISNLLERIIEEKGPI